MYHFAIAAILSSAIEESKIRQEAWKKAYDAATPFERIEMVRKRDHDWRVQREAAEAMRRQEPEKVVVKKNSGPGFFTGFLLGSLF